MSSARFRRLTDLFVDGTEISVGDGTYLWLQSPNSFERDECISDAQVARARLVMAMRENGDERIKLEARAETVGRDAIIEDLAGAKADSRYVQLVSRLEDDPDWREKLTIIRRTDFDTNSSNTPAEQQLVARLMQEWTDELAKRLEDEVAYWRDHYVRATDEDILADYIEAWLSRRGDEVAQAEYTLTEIWFATRYCDATEVDGKFDHSGCNGHAERVFASKAEVKGTPDRLQKLLAEGLGKLAMSLRDPKGSPNPQSSSESLPPPNEEAESTPSTSSATQAEHPGT